MGGRFMTAAAAEEHQRRHRSRRVLLFIAGIIVLSLADLVVTLGYLTSTGMREANPIAGWLISYWPSTWGLVCYKALTVAVCTGLLYRLRRQVEGEVAAWCIMAILALMSLQWYRYAQEAHDLQLVGRPSGDARWVVLD